jgi:hypothetical protein
MTTSDHFFSAVGKFVFGALVNAAMVFVVLVVAGFLSHSLAIMAVGAITWTLTGTAVAHKYFGTSMATGAFLGALVCIAWLVMTSEWP